VDCGAGCSNNLCHEGTQCVNASDCESSVCTSGKCAAPTCDDNIENGDETGMDCGANCGICSGSPCQKSSECHSQQCEGASGTTLGTCK
jgi:hypothetical protein